MQLNMDTSKKEVGSCGPTCRHSDTNSLSAYEQIVPQLNNY